MIMLQVYNTYSLIIYLTSVWKGCIGFVKMGTYFSTARFLTMLSTTPGGSSMAVIVDNWYCGIFTYNRRPRNSRPLLNLAAAPACLSQIALRPSSAISANASRSPYNNVELIVWWYTRSLFPKHFQYVPSTVRSQ